MDKEILNSYTRGAYFSSNNPKNSGVEAIGVKVDEGYYNYSTFGNKLDFVPKHSGICIVKQ